MKNLIKRRCISCRELKNRDEMIKITKFNDDLIINPSSKTMGRSAYVCNNEECIKKMIKSKGIKRNLKFNNDTLIKQAENEILQNFNGSN